MVIIKPGDFVLEPSMSLTRCKRSHAWGDQYSHFIEFGYLGHFRVLIEHYEDIVAQFAHRYGSDDYTHWRPYNYEGRYRIYINNTRDYTWASLL